MNWKTAISLILATCVLACSGATEEPPGEFLSNNSTTMPPNAMNPPSAGAFEGLVINEVVAAGEPDWFEIYNGADTEFDLSQVTFSDDLETPTKGSFSADTTIAAGEYLVVDVSDATVGFKLGKDEELGIFAPDESVIDSVNWNEGDSPDGASYGRFPDGSGDFKTLQTVTRGQPNVDNSDSEASCGDGVREGEEVCDQDDLGDETCASQGFGEGNLQCDANCLGFDTSTCMNVTSDLVINEVQSNDDDQIELYNSGSTTIDLTGWYVTDDGFDPSDPSTNDKRFNLSGFLDAGEYLVLVKGIDHTFGLGKDDAVSLYDPSDTLVDIADWADGEAEPSYCRIPNATGDFQTCSIPTFGDENSTTPDESTVDLVINEVQSNEDDRIELYNNGSATIDLTGWYVTDDAFDPADPTTNEQRFNLSGSLDASEYLVLVKGTDHTFGLGKDDAVSLYDPADTLVDIADWADGEAEPSYCRIPNATGDFQTCATPTFGSENSVP